MIKRIRIREFEKGLLFKYGEFCRLLNKGVHWFTNFNFAKKIDRVSTRDIYLFHQDLELIAKSKLLKDEAIILDLKDTQRALVWKDGRFNRILSTGVHILWSNPFKIRVEIVCSERIRFCHPELKTILEATDSQMYLDVISIKDGFTGILFVDGKLVEKLDSGSYAFWKKAGHYNIYQYDSKEKVLDIAGQDIITSDKVTLRINATISYSIKNPVLAATKVDDISHHIYREAQLALRAVIGTHELDEILQNKDKIASDLETIVIKKSTAYGIAINSLGIRDVILPGEMKELLNKVTEAKKAAEANIISRREEFAAMRSQANTAKMLENNKTLMRLKELEALERIAKHTNFNVVLGDKRLTERLVNML